MHVCNREMEKTVSGRGGVLWVVCCVLMRVAVGWGQEVHDSSIKNSAWGQVWVGQWAVEQCRLSPQEPHITAGQS
jgi:hypothetical protein